MSTKVTTRPTPETDARLEQLWNEFGPADKYSRALITSSVAWELARKLERERNEVMEENAALRAYRARLEKAIAACERVLDRIYDRFIKAETSYDISSDEDWLLKEIAERKFANKKAMEDQT